MTTYLITRHYSGGVLMPPAEWEIDPRLMSGSPPEPYGWAPLGAGAGRYLGSFVDCAQLKTIDPTGLPAWTFVNVSSPHRLGTQMQTLGRLFYWSSGDQRADDSALYDFPMILAPNGAFGNLGRWIWTG